MLSRHQKDFQLHRQLISAMTDHPYHPGFFTFSMMLIMLVTTKRILKIPIKPEPKGANEVLPDVRKYINVWITCFIGRYCETIDYEDPPRR
jgi:hypothetical protein